MSYRGEQTTSASGVTCVSWKEAYRRCTTPKGGSLALLQAADGGDTKNKTWTVWLKDAGSTTAKVALKDARAETFTEGYLPMHGLCEHNEQVPDDNRCRSPHLDLSSIPANEGLWHPFAGYASEGPWCFVEYTDELAARGEPGVLSAEAIELGFQYVNSSKGRLAHYLDTACDGLMRASCGIPPCARKRACLHATRPKAPHALEAKSSSRRRLLLAQGDFEGVWEDASDRVLRRGVAGVDNKNYSDIGSLLRLPSHWVVGFARASEDGSFSEISDAEEMDGIARCVSGENIYPRMYEDLVKVQFGRHSASSQHVQLDASMLGSSLVKNGDPGCTRVVLRSSLGAASSLRAGAQRRY